ncbi:MAG: 16S rRNA (cytidine(1402)-2'-O)-methyltransferase [Clostridia bacterium]|nr:16S rRNA (cytidine(1402)-2'-O)-methyltransferase [Clostridia bacterium]
MSGTLYLCATPIGNLSDVSTRFIKTLELVDIIAAEDTRVTLKLLNHFNIKKQLTSYHEHNKHEKGEYLVSLLKEGKNVALVSDAGTPAISDPGEDLVGLCIENDINVTSIPGCVALINALILSGLSTKRFSFEGFLSVNKRHRKEHLKSLANDTHTMIFYEAPHKLPYTLSDMAEVFGMERKIALVRELTKLHEEVLRLTLGEAIAKFNEDKPRGEYVIIIDGCSEEEIKTEEEWWSELSVIEHVDRYIEKGTSSKDAIKQTALDRNVSKRDVYNEYHKS